MRFVDPKGGTEAVGNRILTVPADVPTARMRDPKTKFVSYVAPGTLARGKTLVEMGDRARAIIACGTCHGKDMMGQTMKGPAGSPGTIVPRIAGIHPMLLTRELVIFKDGTRAGAHAKLMAPAVKNLTDEDIVAIAAYLASVDPTAGK
jgi:cytochrome c553